MAIKDYKYLLMETEICIGTPPQCLLLIQQQGYAYKSLFCVAKSGN